MEEQNRNKLEYLAKVKRDLDSSTASLEDLKEEIIGQLQKLTEKA